MATAQVTSDNSKMPTSMRAAYVQQLGPADNIRYGELPVPSLGPTDVLVQVEAVAVNPVDLLVRSGPGPHPHRSPL